MGLRLWADVPPHLRVSDDFESWYRMKLPPDEERCLGAHGPDLRVAIQGKFLRCRYRRKDGMLTCKHHHALEGIAVRMPKPLKIRADGSVMIPAYEREMLGLKRGRSVAWVYVALDTDGLHRQFLALEVAGG